MARNGKGPMVDPKEMERPYLVILVGLPLSRGFVRGYEDPHLAGESAKERNQRAEELGLKARYAVFHGRRSNVQQR